MQRFRADVEGLRAVAVVAVVLYHAGVPLTDGGFVGVDVFFVLSGFLITGLLRRELRATGRVSFREFYARRARRLLPAAVLVLAFTVAASALVFSPLRAADVGRDAAAAAAYAANYRFALVRTDYLAASAPSPLLHFWSLAVEEQFYLVWPLLLVAAYRARRTALVLGVVAVASFAACVWLTDASQPWAFFSLPTRAWELALGGLVALAAGRLRNLRAWVAAVLGWAGLVAIVAAVLAYGATTPFPGVAALLPVLGTAAVVVAGCAAPRYGVQRVLGVAPLRTLGRLSYSWYLWHFPLLVLWEGAPPLLVAFGSLLPAALTLRLVENPIRFSPRLKHRPGLSLTGGAVLTAAATAGALLVVAALPAPRGSGTAVAAPVLSATPAPRADPATPPPSVADKLAATVTDALADAVGVRAVPAELDPPLARARADKPVPYHQGCHVAFDGSDPGHCSYGTGPTTVALYGDSHATMWFTAFDQQRFTVLPMSKSACPPAELEVFSPVFGRPYRECVAYRDAVVARVARERPDVVVVGTARHYEPVYRFDVYSAAWNAGLAATVRRLQAAGARSIVVLGPAPRPSGDVPDCLASHLDDARRCTRPRAEAVNPAGIAGERAAVEAAGGTYVDVTPWVCVEVCPVVVGTMLVYRDDNHLSTVYPTWLAPLVTATLAGIGGST